MNDEYNMQDAYKTHTPTIKTRELNIYSINRLMRLFEVYDNDFCIGVTAKISAKTHNAAFNKYIKSKNKIKWEK